MKFLVPNYSCLQNPWLGGYHPQIPVLSVLNWICWTPPKKIPGYATDQIWRAYVCKRPASQHMWSEYLKYLNTPAKYFLVQSVNWETWNNLTADVRPYLAALHLTMRSNSGNITQHHDIDKHGCNQLQSPRFSGLHDPRYSPVPSLFSKWTHSNRSILSYLCMPSLTSNHPSKPSTDSKIPLA